MPLPHKTKLHHVNDAQVRAILTDPEGGTATFGDWIDVPGIKTVGVGGAVNTTELRGDNQLLDQQTVITGISGEISHARISLDVLAVMTGGTVADTGATPNMKSSFSLAGDSLPGYFELQAISVKGQDSPIQQAALIFPKCVISGFPEVGFAEEDYRIFSGAFVCMPRLSDSEWFDIDFLETPAPIDA